MAELEFVGGIQRPAKGKRDAGKWECRTRQADDPVEKWGPHPHRFLDMSVILKGILRSKFPQE